MKRTRHERAAAIAKKRPPGLIVEVITDPAAPDDLPGVIRLLRVLLDDRARSGRA